MNENFWRTAWKEGRTGFHKNQFNLTLTKFFSLLVPKPGDKILVPLCGKSKDLIWLSQLNLKVSGVELYEEAVKEFFSENHLEDVQTTDESGFRKYESGNINIRCGSYFDLNEDGTFDFVYDRASLVALPESMRSNYVDVTTRALKVGGKYLLLVYSYDQSKMDGPPFSISDQEIHSLFDKHFSIKLLESGLPADEGGKLSGVIGLSQNVYLMEKLH